jgi:transcriptional regulator with XRE-family HTH domain
MGRAGKALKQVLKDYGISQYQLAVTMQVDRSNVSRWVSEERDPSSEALHDIHAALNQLNPAAAQKFIACFLEGPS